MRFQTEATGIWTRLPTLLRLLFVATVVLTGGLIGTWSASAAPSTTPDELRTPIHVRVIRTVTGPDCRSSCDDWVALDGPIGAGSYAVFARTLRDMTGRQPAILLNSRGGSVNDAIAIGRLIRARHLDVAIGKAEPVSCPSDRVACERKTPRNVEIGMPNSVGAICASACPLILAGGIHRLVSPRAAVGVHEFKTFRTQTKYFDRFRILTRDEAGVKTVIRRTLISHIVTSRTVTRVSADYAATEHYLVEMGVDPEILSLFHLASPDHMYWLSSRNLKDLKLETSDQDGWYLVSHNHDLAVLVGSATELASNNPIDRSSAKSSALPGRDEGSQEAALEENYGQHRVFSGRVHWSVRETKGVSIQGPTLIANVSLSNGLGDMEIELDHMVGATEPPLLRLSLTLHIRSRCPLPLVQTIDTPMVRQTEFDRPVALHGVRTASSPDTTALLLPQLPAQNIIELGEWIDVPLNLDGGNTATIHFARGAAGENAFLRWRALDMKHSQDLAHTGLDGRRS